MLSAFLPTKVASSTEQTSTTHSVAIHKESPSTIADSTLVSEISSDPGRYLINASTVSVLPLLVPSFVFDDDGNNIEGGASRIALGSIEGTQKLQRSKVLKYNH